MHSAKKILLLCLAFFAFTSAVQADGDPTIQLRVAIDGAIIFDQTLTVPPCAATASSTPTSSLFCALESSGLTPSWGFFGEDAFLDSLAGQSNNENGNNIYWLYFANSVFGEHSMNTEILANGERLLVEYNTPPLRIEPFAEAPQAFATSTIVVSEFGFDVFFNPTWSPSSGALVHISSGEELITIADGTAEWLVGTSSPFSLNATKSGFAGADPIDVTPLAPPPPPTRTLHLIAQATSTVLFDDKISFSPCAPETGAPENYTLFCAVEASGLAPTWTWFGDMAFLDSLAGIANNTAGNNIFWFYFLNEELGFNAMNSEILQGGDTIALGYGAMPLRIKIATTTPTVGETMMADVEEFSFDQNFNPQWLVAEGALLMASDGREFQVGTSSVAVVITSVSPFSLHAEKAGAIISSDVFINPIEATSSTPEEGSGSNEGNSNGSGGGGGGGGATPLNLDIEKLLNFLDLYQHPDGSFGADLYSDWVAIAYSATTGHDDSRSRLSEFLKQDELDGGLITDAERRAMALMSLGINPATGAKDNYIKKIIAGFDGTQFGDPTLYNDDIFAIIALERAGFIGDPMLKKSADFVTTFQHTNGGWDGPDITAAAVQALTSVPGDSQITSSLTNAIANLRSSQTNDGGWGSSFATSWALGAFAALNVDPRSVETNNHDGIDYLTPLQQSDGGMENTTTALNTRIWATAYAVPAAVGKSWRDLLSSFVRATENGQEVTGNAGSSQTTTATTTDAGIATTTPAVLGETATTTPPGLVLGESTTTPIAVGEKLEPKGLFPVQNRKVTVPTTATKNSASAPALQDHTPVTTKQVNIVASPLFSDLKIYWPAAGALILIAGWLWFTKIF